MGTVVVKSRVGSNGVLHLDVPLDATLAGREVEIAVTPVENSMTEAEKKVMLKEVVGSLDDDFDIPPLEYFPLALQHMRNTTHRFDRPTTQEAWAEWVRSMAGSITDPSFVRPEQGEYEVREPLE